MINKITKKVTCKSVILAAMAGTFIFISFQLMPKSKVNYEEVRQKVLNKKDGAIFSKGLEEALIKFSGSDKTQVENNAKMALAAINSVPEDNRQEFEKSFESALRNALVDKDLSPQGRMEVVNNYLRLQIETYKNQENVLSKLIRMENVLSAAIIFALLANLLVLLGIERNTRK